MNQLSATIPAKESAEDLFQTLLVAYDSSEASETALQYAIAIAQIFHAVVTVAYVQPPSEFGMAEGLSHLRESHREIADTLKLVAQRLDVQGIRNRVVHRSGAVGDVLVQLAAEGQADLLLLGAYGHKKDVQRLGSTAEYMLRSMPCSVLTIGPGAVLRGRGVGEMRMLLYASSLPANPGRIREVLKALARHFKARVEIIHGISDPSRARDMHLHTEQIAADQAAAEKLRNELQTADVETTWRFVSHLDGERIAERSREIHADVIVFGIEHHPADPGIMGMISTAIRMADCPVLTLPGPA